MSRANGSSQYSAAVSALPRRGSWSAPWRWPLALVPLVVVAVVAWSSPLAAQQTYTWSNGANTGLWGTGSNWVGNPTPTFNNQTNLIFDSASVVNPTNTLAINGNRTIRSLTINADYATQNNATFDIRTYETITGTPRTLTFSAASGNASISVAQSTAGTVQVRLGINNGGNVVLSSSLDLAQNNTFFNATGFQFEGPVSGAGAINKTGLGEVRLVRNNSGWSGGMNINEGNVTIFNDANAMGTGTWALGGGANNTSFSVGSTQTFSNAGGLTVAAGAGTRTILNSSTSVATGNPTLGSTVTLNKNATFSVTQYTAGTHDRLTVSGAITGTGGIVKTNTGILILSGSGNNYSGTTDIQGGKFYLGGNGRLGSGAVTIASGANLDFGTGVGQTNVVANNISGDGLIIQSTADTDTRLTGNVTSTGGMQILSGIVRIGNDGTAGSYTGNAVVSSGAQLAFSRSDAYTHSGTISGSGTVVKVAAGDTTLSGSNSYSGQTTLFTGALVADNASALGTGVITFSADGGNAGTIRYTAASAGTDWASRIKNSAGTIRLDTGSNTVILAGVIDSTNVGGLVKSGAGALGLTGSNSYAGATTVAAGILVVANGSALGGTAAGTTVAPGAGLRLDGVTVGNEALTISGTGPSGWVLRSATGANTWGGKVTLAADATIQAASGSSLTLDVASGDAVDVGSFTATFSGAGNNLVNDPIAGTGGVTKAGSGILTLSGNSTYGGVTTVSLGKLLVNGNNSAATGALTVAAGATLGGSGTIGGATAVDGTLSPGNSPGVLSIASLVLGGSSTSLFEIGGASRGTAYDGVDITQSGGLTYGGALSLTFTSTFGDNTTFNLFDFAGAFSGNFSSVTATGLYGSLTFSNDGFGVWTSGSTSVPGQTMTFTQSTGDLAIVPEPGALALAGLGIAAACALRRRRARGSAARSRP
jgi:fibronectin-binding autotransporter adhesin